MEVGMSGENTKVYLPQGGDELVVASGGKISVQSGGELKVGDTDFAAILAAIPTADAEDGATIWNDGGVLKVSTSA
jgi:hypothetical protein